MLHTWPVSATSIGTEMTPKVIPRSIRRRLHPVTRILRLTILVAILWKLKLISGSKLPERTAHRLYRCWSNGGWTGNPRYLREVAVRCHQSDGPILECGSGLTTLIAAVYGRFPCWSLEQREVSRRRVERVARWAGLTVHTLLVPLEAMDGFTWYSVPSQLPDHFSLVICDGPPGTTEGGRYGLMPILGDRIAGGTIILDDTDRIEEQDIVRRWQQEYMVEVVSGQDTFTTLRA